MSCWVVPNIAAELWSVPLEQVLRCIAEGTVPSKSDAGFTFVDVAPASRSISPARTPPSQRPPTYVTVTPMPVRPPAENLAPEPEKESSDDLADWRLVRRQVERRRLAPRRAA